MAYVTPLLLNVYHIQYSLKNSYVLTPPNMSILPYIMEIYIHTQIYLATSSISLNHPISHINSHIAPCLFLLLLDRNSTLYSYIKMANETLTPTSIYYTQTTRVLYKIYSSTLSHSIVTHANTTYRTYCITTPLTSNSTLLTYSLTINTTLLTYLQTNAYYPHPTPFIYIYIY